MTEYIKICPKCGSHNPEEAQLCGNMACSEFIRNVLSVPAPTPADPEERNGDFSDPSEAPTHEDGEKEDRVTTRLLRRVLCLECLTTAKTFEIESGHIVGQSHPTSRAHIQMADIPNINYVSREHCRFDCENGRWFVTAIKTATNPTYLNQLLLKSGEKLPARNGDRLMMANVPFQVRIIET